MTAATLADRPLDVDPSAYTAASAVLGRQAADRLAGALGGLAGGLAGTAAMGGSDPGGVAWAAAYDEAAAVAAAGIADLTNACHTVAALLAQSGFNHAAADAASNPANRAPAPDTTDYARLAVVVPPPLPSASGGSVGPPDGWDLVQNLVGYVWPDGNPAALRLAGAAWSTAADGVSAAAALVPTAVAAIREVQSPEIDDAVAVCQALGGHMTEIAAVGRDLAALCAEYADHIEQCHRDVEDELVSLLAWTVGIEAAGLVVGVFTAGVGELGAQAVEAGRVAASAARIGAFLARLIEAARTVAAAIERVVARVAGVAQRVKTILGGRLSRATAEAAERLPAVAEDAEAAAEERLATAARGTVDESVRGFSPQERKIADRLADDGHDVAAADESGPGRHFDAFVDGRPTEFKTVDPGGTSATIKNELDKSAKAGGQARDVIIDAEASGMSEEEARLGIARFLGNKKNAYDSITIWLADGARVVWP